MLLNKPEPHKIFQEELIEAIGAAITIVAGRNDISFPVAGEILREVIYVLEDHALKTEDSGFSCKQSFDSP